MGLLIVMAIAGIGMSGVGIMWHQEAQREREKELLFIGAAYQQAIGRFYESGASGFKQYPQSLQDLLLDNRAPTITRHIRRLYADPFAQNDKTQADKAQIEKSWGLVLEQGQIKGVYSKSALKPIKKFGFSGQNESFGEAATYSDWRFVYAPGNSANDAAASNAPPVEPAPEIVTAETPLFETLPDSVNKQTPTAD